MYDVEKLNVIFFKITFIFDRCHRSWAAKTPVKYKRDIQYVYVTSTLKDHNVGHKSYLLILTNEFSPTRSMMDLSAAELSNVNDDVMKWKHFPRYWPFVRGIHRSPVNPPHEGQWRRALTFSLICTWISCWTNNRDAGDLRRHRAHYHDTLMNLKKNLQWSVINCKPSGLQSYKGFFLFIWILYIICFIETIPWNLFILALTSMVV